MTASGGNLQAMRTVTKAKAKKLCLELELENVFRAPSLPEVEFSRLSELVEGFWDAEELPTQLLPAPPDNGLWAATIRCPLRFMADNLENATGACVATSLSGCEIPMRSASVA
jgi:hypothetical protein